MGFRGWRNLSAFARVELALKLEPLLRKQAKEKQREHGGTAPGKTLVQNSAEVNTRKELAKAAHVSHDTIAKGKVILAGTTQNEARPTPPGGGERSPFPPLQARLLKFRF